MTVDGEAERADGAVEVPTAVGNVATADVRWRNVALYFLFKLVFIYIIGLIINNCRSILVGAESDQHVNIYSFAIRCDRIWPST